MLAEILEEAEEVEISHDDIKERARIIEQTLADFGLPVRVVEANPGPAVTQFGLQPGYRERRRSRDELRREAEEILKQRGYGSSRRPITEDLLKEVTENEVEKYERVKIKVSRIQALTNDLALALSASPIRIEAPVPGRPMVGLEVPNTQKALVSLRGVLESDTFREMKSPLKIALGQDTSGQSAVADLARDAPPAGGRRHRLRQVGLRQLDHRHPAADPHPRHAALPDDRPQDGRADHLQRHPAPAVAGGGRVGAGRAAAALGHGRDGPSLQALLQGRRAQRRCLQREDGQAAASRCCPTSSW